MSNPTIFEALKWASSYLQEKERDQNAGELLLLHILGWSRSTLLAEQRTELTEVQWSLFQNYVEAHVNSQPVQYIIGKETFYGRDFRVTPDVLIPRPETEELVEAVISRTSALKDGTLVDIGTGSGAIAVTLKMERPDLHVFATDLSTKALTIAKHNAEAIGVNIDFLEGDLLQPLINKGIKVDVLVSNPPYIPFTDQFWMSPIVLEHEPHSALFAEEEGLVLYRKMIENAHQVFEKELLLAFEVGVGQARRIAEMIYQHYPHTNVEIVEDINKKERIVIAKLIK
ncbi:peptide chain release factor N(5)-glutamine methyltransferase [Mangrovibacillus cuniculi]|uniref:Release factor glutamine methyltransferase n=1 Tax=Mangrovibacillus cuniculi TaxID=2593652 RepID=A0A7S8HGE6_9BACI|nr:peptide chain release factor N(5)-glutamine methyltransferase [Mangrovibacillus cuniculi]QPC47722.1 peptide chain release factor N(5)-glutamine methyltransferase [Mangrovibacillus cuniculi]